jgi:hypothetical protein
MKSSTINMMLATAALMVASNVVSAAEMKFEIPFAFQAGGKVMAPGTYTVRGARDESNFLIRNKQSSEGIYLLSQGTQEPRKEWQDEAGGVLRFECNGGGCALTQVWTHDNFPAHLLPGSKKTQKGQDTRLAVIRSVVDNGK